MTQADSTTASLISKINAIIDPDTERLQSIFKDIHQNSELGFMETRTAGIVARELKAQGYKVKNGIGGTGVVGILENGKGPTVMFRADMDANALEEKTGLPYASKVRVTNLNDRETFVAHMCGHDAHTTWLISLAKTMSELRDEWSGTLVLVAQPAEEPIEGAKAMIEDGLYTRHGVPEPDYFFVLHTSPYPTGMIVATVGRLMTSSEHIDVIFHGHGGHGSSPHHSKDPVVMAGTAIMQFQTIISRRIDPEETGVLTIGSIQAGVDNNVIPNESILRLKLHAESKKVHDELVENIKLIANSIAAGYGLSEDMMPTILHKGFASAVVNSRELVERARELLPQMDGITEIINDRTVPGSDDAFLLIKGIEKAKGAYLFLGTAEPAVFAAARAKGREFPFFPHEPYYAVDLNAIPLGAKVASLLVLDKLARIIH